MSLERFIKNCSGFIAGVVVFLLVAGMYLSSKGFVMDEKNVLQFCMQDRERSGCRRCMLRIRECRSQQIGADRGRSVPLFESGSSQYIFHGGMPASDMT